NLAERPMVKGSGSLFHFGVQSKATPDVLPGSTTALTSNLAQDLSTSALNSISRLPGCSAALVVASFAPREPFTGNLPTIATKKALFGFFHSRRRNVNSREYSTARGRAVSLIDCGILGAVATVIGRSPERVAFALCPFQRGRAAGGDKKLSP